MVGTRRGQILEMLDERDGHDAISSSRSPRAGLIGCGRGSSTRPAARPSFITATSRYKPMQGDVPQRPNGVLISQEAGKAVAFALGKLQDRAECSSLPAMTFTKG